MSIEAALVAALTADAGVAALLGSRVFPVGGRQGADYPYLTFERISTPTAPSLDGASTLDWPRFQIDVWAEKAVEAVAAAEAVRAALDAIQQSGTTPNFYATLQDHRGPAADEETRKFRVSQDYYLWHERT